jgi:hypothetical protein
MQAPAGRGQVRWRLESNRLTCNVTGAPVPQQRIVRGPLTAAQAACHGGMGPGRGRGRVGVGCCGVRQQTNKTARRPHAHRLVLLVRASPPRVRHAVQAVRRVHHASYHSEHLVLGDRLARPAHVRIQLAVRDATLSGRWPAAAGACDRYDPPVACSPKLQIAHACPKTRHICTGTAHDFAPANPTRRGELGGVGRYARRCAASLRANSTAAGGCVPMACWSTPATES